MSGRFKRKIETKTSRFQRKLKLVSSVPEIEEKPKRTRRNKPQYWIKQFHAIPNEIVVPSPFGVYSDKEKLGYHTAPLILQSGKIEMRISGRKLNVKDSDVFIALTELAVKYECLDFTTNVSELCGRLGNSYTLESKNSIRKSLRRLRLCF